MRKLYGAYGSNMNIDDMFQRCPSAKVYGVSRLENYELAFEGEPLSSYLTVEPSDSSYVPLAIWSITENDEKRLDYYEGYPDFYQKKTFKLPVRTLAPSGKLLDNEATEEVLIYIMNPGYNVCIPSMEYLLTCLMGYEEFDFDQNILLEAYSKASEAMGLT